MAERDPGQCSDFADAKTLDAWPNCSVADCEYKSCLSLDSDKCFAHAQGRNPSMSLDEYMNQPQGDDD